MGDKRKGTTQSQTLGIVWLSVASTLIAGIAFFCSRQGADTAVADTATVADTAVLAEKELSHYRSERHGWHHERRHAAEHGDRRAERRVDTSFYGHVPPPPTRQPLVVDINEADTTTLQLLHGIGPAYARRIASYRDRLGGFVGAEQLLEVYGMTPQLLEHIRPHLRFGGGIRRIAVNSADLKRLVRHPYVEYYQARDIVELRRRGVRFRNADDLRAVPSMTDTTLQKLLPYVDFAVDSLP